MIRQPLVRKAFDFSIPGDEVEQDRIQLENDLQNANLSFHLSSSPTGGSQNDEMESVEYPRHVSGPTPFPDFVSLEHKSREYFEEEHDHLHPWSYRTADEDEGINPFGGVTISTAAHHASALTLSAGLGGRGQRRDVSLSGVEYDPDRPLHEIISGATNKIGALSIEPSRSHYSGDPLVVDNTAELDRILESGHAPPSQHRSLRVRSPHSSSASESDTSRHKLSEALKHVSFSPRRPRSTLSHHSSPSPRSAGRQHNILRRASRTEALLRPPTPSIAAPKFAKFASGHFNNITSRSGVHLPDITGLTNAVESPAKPSLLYHPYENHKRPREIDTHMLTTLSAVQTKLFKLEEENSISRRRIRELELELEVCKREVVRERTRVLEREEVIVQHQKELDRIAPTAGKGEERVQRVEDDLYSATRRYREVVEEKKALEALISSLRSHLTRLTSELSSHQQLLIELRNLRDADAHAMKEKADELDRLRGEVERLAGEVEVLRGVVEEGLKERRAIRETGDVNDRIGNQEAPISGDRSELAEDSEDEEQVQPTENLLAEFSDQDVDDPPSIIGSSRVNIDKTMQTDHATLGSTNLASVSKPIVDNEDLERISDELEERQSERIAMSRIASPPSQHRDSSPVPGPSQSQVVVTRPTTPTPRDTLNASGAPHCYETPFPQIRGAHLERLFFSAPDHNQRTCTACHRHRHAGSHTQTPCFLGPNRQARMDNADVSSGEDEGFAEGPDTAELEIDGRTPNVGRKGKERDGTSKKPNSADIRRPRTSHGSPPQTVLMRVIRELEDDFTHYKSIYIELANQYKEMDAVSNVSKRHLLAQHLREVVDILEQKGDQIASLYDLLTFKDKPTSQSAIPSIHTAE